MATDISAALAAITGGVGAGLQGYSEERDRRRQQAYEQAMRDRIQSFQEAQAKLQAERAARSLQLEEAANTRAQGTFEAGAPERQYSAMMAQQGMKELTPIPFGTGQSMYDMQQQGEQGYQAEKRGLDLQKLQEDIALGKAHENLYRQQGGYYGRRPGTTTGAGAKPPNPQAQVNTYADDNRSIIAERKALRDDYGPISEGDKWTDPEAEMEYKQLGVDLAYNLSEMARLRKELGQTAQPIVTDPTEAKIAELKASGLNKLAARAVLKTKKKEWLGRRLDTKRIETAIEAMQ